MPAEFRLRFPTCEVLYWAARYSCADDAEVEAMPPGCSAVATGGER